MFKELLENHLNPATLSSQGGSPFTLVVTNGLDALMTGDGVATLEIGERISAGAVHRLTCRARNIPMVLDGDSMPLDFGREQRLFNKCQRAALARTTAAASRSTATGQRRGPKRATRAPGTKVGSPTSRM